ncbi:MAG: LacI family DNA-binding transcriptional regulator [Ignavibacteriales bacterium]|nr:LacI family DNA-binding transcriptional regulator [Ignavibacteriales bacterium]
MSATIKNVAEKAGVSTATVSLVIHGNSRISNQTKKKVQNAIKDLDFHPSRSARGLVSKITGNIGFILTDDHFLRTEPFYTRIFLGTEFEARDGEYYVLLTTIKSDFDENSPLPRYILEKNVDGIIIAGKVPQNLIDRICTLKLPIVFVDFEISNNNCPSILIDNFQGGVLAAQHLIQLGHKNIGFIGGDIMHPSIRGRLNGYKHALEKANLKIKNNLIVIDAAYPDRQYGYRSVQKLLKQNENVTAIFACNDAMAIGAMHFLKENNYKIPEDISIIGFDDVEADLLLDPPLTTIRVPKVELGAEALRVIIELIKNKSNAKKILVPVELIIRKSTKQLEK